MKSANTIILIKQWVLLFDVILKDVDGEGISHSSFGDASTGHLRIVNRLASYAMRSETFQEKTVV